jgi:hypothetical protein
MTLAYLMQYRQDSAYVTDQEPTESLKAYKKIMYDTILYYTHPPQESLPVADTTDMAGQQLGDHMVKSARRPDTTIS